MMGTVTREQAITAAAAAIVEGRRQRDSLPVAEAARRAFTPTGPALPELEARIAARRTNRAEAA